MTDSAVGVQPNPPNPAAEERRNGRTLVDSIAYALCAQDESDDADYGIDNQSAWIARQLVADGWAGSVPQSTQRPPESPESDENAVEVALHHLDTIEPSAVLAQINASLDGQLVTIYTEEFGGESGRWKAIRPAPVSHGNVMAGDPMFDLCDENDGHMLMRTFVANIDRVVRR